MTDPTTPEPRTAEQSFSHSEPISVLAERGYQIVPIEAQARPAVASDRCVCGHLNATCTVPEGAHRG